jgi:hypothetical protein
MTSHSTLVAVAAFAVAMPVALGWVAALACGRLLTAAWLLPLLLACAGAIDGLATVGNPLASLALVFGWAACR